MITVDSSTFQITKKESNLLHFLCGTMACNFTRSSFLFTYATWRRNFLMKVTCVEAALAPVGTSQALCLGEGMNRYRNDLFILKCILVELSHVKDICCEGRSMFVRKIHPLCCHLFKKIILHAKQPNSHASFFYLLAASMTSTQTSGCRL